MRSKTTRLPILRKASRLLLIVGMIASFGAITPPNPAHSAPPNTIHVTTTEDDTVPCSDIHCSLRGAILAANEDPLEAPYLILLPVTTTPITYTLSISGTEELEKGEKGDLDIKVPMTIEGQGAVITDTVIDGGGIDRVFHIVASSIAVTITNVTIQHGYVIPDSNPSLISYANMGGGGILNSGILGSENKNGSLTLLDTVVRNNIAQQGAGISNQNVSKITIKGSIIENNGNTDPFLDDVTTKNGGGVNSNGPLEITSSHAISTTIANNRGERGGGIFDTKRANMVLDSLILEGNQATQEGGGIFNDQSARLSNVTIKNNHAPNGGGISTDQTLSLNSVTLNNNTADQGAGIYNNTGGTAFLTNVTLSGNQATNKGGAIFNGNSGIVNLVNTTIYQNNAPHGGNIYNTFDAQTLTQNTIIAGSTGGNNCFNESYLGLFGKMISNGYNLEDANTCSLAAIGDQPSTNPKLWPLANNRGKTWTHMLFYSDSDTSSPAIDGGDPNSCPPNDQRGFFRPVDGLKNGTPVCDIGSVEIITGGYIGFNPTVYSTTENGAPTLILTITRSGGAAAGTVHYSTYSITNTDFIPVSGDLTWTLGDWDPRQITIQIVDNDKKDTGPVLVILSKPTGGLGFEAPNNTATITIEDNDLGKPPPSPPQFLPYLRR